MCSAQEPQGVEGGYLGSNPHQMEVLPMRSTVGGGPKKKKFKKEKRKLNIAICLHFVYNMSLNKCMLMWVNDLKINIQQNRMRTYYECLASSK